jgi:predicted DNA-binding antitoxin AbrB/MazE fold protein
LDNQGVESGEQNREISLLRYENGELKPKKKRNIQFDGNAEFVKVLAIKKKKKNSGADDKDHTAH